MVLSWIFNHIEFFFKKCKIVYFGSTIQVAWYEWVQSSTGIPLDLIAYLRTSPGIAHDRITLRARPEERPVDLQFIGVRCRIIIIKSYINVIF